MVKIASLKFVGKLLGIRCAKFMTQVTDLKPGFEKLGSFGNAIIVNLVTATQHYMEWGLLMLAQYI